jgi:hypothetical protein
MQVIQLNKKKYIHATATQRAEVEEKIKKMRKEDEKPVKGMFEFVDAGGGWFDFSYRKYKQPIDIYKIVHGEICEIPWGIVKHLNNLFVKVRMMPKQLDENGRALGLLPVTRRSRTKFTPIECLPEDLVRENS